MILLTVCHGDNLAQIITYLGSARLQHRQGGRSKKRRPIKSDSRRVAQRFNIIEGRRWGRGLAQFKKLCVGDGRPSTTYGIMYAGRDTKMTTHPSQVYEGILATHEGLHRNRRLDKPSPPRDA